MEDFAGHDRPTRPSGAGQPRDYREFWPLYVGQHAAPLTRLLHMAGTILGVAALLAALAIGSWWFVLAAPVVSYGLAWSAHFFVERNRPATFAHPLWSLRADFEMCARMLSGRMHREVARVRSAGPPR
ncbi:MAG: DUF962 domain-containing protein [Rhodospirillaceae bacterium]|nr:DUF962 domain-containing protein [Rhodospirillaceae bacterium]